MHVVILRSFQSAAVFFQAVPIFNSFKICTWSCILLSRAVPCLAHLVLYAPTLESAASATSPSKGIWKPGSRHCVRRVCPSHGRSIAPSLSVSQGMKVLYRIIAVLTSVHLYPSVCFCVRREPLWIPLGSTVESRFSASLPIWGFFLQQQKAICNVLLNFSMYMISTFKKWFQIVSVCLCRNTFTDGFVWTSSVSSPESVSPAVTFLLGTWFTSLHCD